MSVNSPRRVHLIFKTHLDVGFTDYARNVVARYFSDFIPRALTTAHTMRKRGADRFVWTTGSWLIYEALERADAAQRRVLEAAIEAGDITWHALPFTTHSELMDESLFEFGLSLSAELDTRFGHRTIAAKMTDVPGHSRSIVRLMAAAGVQFLHIGVNEASTPPDVPPVFVWREPGGRELLVMYQFGGYGDLSIVPGLDDALAFAHTGDNLGPQTPADVQQNFVHMRERLPGAQVFGSTLDAFAERLLTIKEQLPVLTQELGDTWIHGVGTDPLKVARFRELCRLRRSWLAERRADPAALNKFSRSLLMVPEHTWGMDEKTHLKDYDNYTGEAFRVARTTPKFQAFEASWAEQRAYLDDAIAALEPAQLAAEARTALAGLTPHMPDLSGYTAVDPAAGPWDTTHYTIGFDPASGAMTTLTARAGGRAWADATHPLAWLRYQTFSHVDYDHFRERYNINKRVTAFWSIDDYTKPGIERTNAVSRWWTPALAGLWHSEQQEAVRFVAELHVPEEAAALYGGPRRVFLEAAFPVHDARVELTLQWFEKPACRLPEALWLSFVPRISEPHGWEMDKLGQSVSPLDVVRNGNRRLHAVGTGVSYRDAHGGLMIETLDAPLVAPGEPALLRFTNRQPPMRRGVHVNLYNNQWGTNFPMWFEEDMRFRFVLRPVASR